MLGSHKVTHISSNLWERDKGWGTNTFHGWATGSRDLLPSLRAAFLDSWKGKRGLGLPSVCLAQPPFLQLNTPVIWLYWFLNFFLQKKKGGSSPFSHCPFSLLENVFYKRFLLNTVYFTPWPCNAPCKCTYLTYWKLDLGVVVYTYNTSIPEVESRRIRSSRSSSATWL